MKRLLLSLHSLRMQIDNGIYIKMLFQLANGHNDAR